MGTAKSRRQPRGKAGKPPNGFPQCAPVGNLIRILSPPTLIGTRDREPWPGLNGATKKVYSLEEGHAREHWIA